MQAEEKELINRCLNGDKSAQSLLYHRYASKMLGVCYRYMQTVYEAEDVLQEGFIKVFRSLETFRNYGALEGWIRRIMVNAALDYLRKNKKLRTETDIDNIEDEPYTDDTYRNFDTEELIRKIKALPEGYRVIFNLYAIEGYTHKEIAEKTGITESTSRSQYSRAKAILKKQLKVEEYSNERTVTVG
jgi:RNA polymerase sigma factor (sigma-70 family)